MLRVSEAAPRRAGIFSGETAAAVQAPTTRVADLPCVGRTLTRREGLPMKNSLWIRARVGGALLLAVCGAWPIATSPAHATDEPVIDARGEWWSENGSEKGEWQLSGTVSLSSNNQFRGSVRLDGMPGFNAAEVEGEFERRRLKFATVTPRATDGEALNQALQGADSIEFDATLKGVRLEGTFVAGGKTGFWDGWWTTRKRSKASPQDSTASGKSSGN